MKKLIIPVICLFLGIVTACSDWLDVKPSDRISEETAFSTIAGFKEALNGVYIELNQNSLYGRALTSEFIEILAQRYAVSSEATANYLLTQYEYGGSDAMARASSIWQKAYNLIANTNLILKNCELRREILPDDYYHLIKGEALALRALLHFDMFRLFGPIYSQDSLVESIPYYTEFALDVNESKYGNDFMRQVIHDLTNAETELSEDPIITKGPQGDKIESFKSFRNLRLNYYAVQALLARAYLYKGDNVNALIYAKKVIEVQESYFPWVNQLDIQGSENPDRMFSSEILFSLQNLNRNSVYTSLFDGNSLKTDVLLAPREDVTKYIFDDEKQDYRYVSWFGGSVELGGVNYKIFNKYQGKDSLYSQMIPMIKISEMYLIAAEAEENAADGVEYFNELRNHRGLEGIRSSWLAWSLEEEWRREFIGEGQLFFYYKRNNLDEIKSAYSEYGSISIKSVNYKLPIPDGELKYN